MTVTLERDALLGVVRKVASAVQSRNTIPILSNVLFEADGDVARLTGTDLDLQVRAECAAKGELATTLPADKLAAAIDSLKPGSITIETVEGRQAVVLKQGRSVRTLPTLPATDFPQFVVDDPTATFEVENRVLTRLIEAAHVAQAIDDAARIYLNGVYLHVRDGALRAVGLDGLRMVRVDAPLPDGAAEMPAMIIPTKAVGLVRKLILGGDEPITIEACGGKTIFVCGSVRILAKMIDGTFPDYDRITPGEGPHKLDVHRNALVDAMSSAVAVVEGDGKDRIRSLAFNLNADAELELSARDQSGTDAVEPLSGTYEGDPIRFSVNSKLLISIANVFRESSTIRIELTDPAKPFRITSEAEPDLLALSGVMRG